MKGTEHPTVPRKYEPGDVVRLSEQLETEWVQGRIASLCGPGRDECAPGQPQGDHIEPDLGQRQQPRLADSMSYRATHGRLWRARGRAAHHPCAGCGQPAHHWAYDHTDPYQLSQLWHGKPVVYSLDLSRYEPLCRSCHSKRDSHGYEGSPLQRTNLRRRGSATGKAWTGGSTRAWRKLRLLILARDSHRCRLQVPAVCTWEATQVAHVHGKAVTGDDPRYLVASCRACNLNAPRDPAPRPVTQW